MANENTSVNSVSTSEDTSNNTENQEQSQENVEISPVAESAQVAAKKEEAKYLKSLKLKVDKGEIEETLPFEIPDTEEAREYMTKHLQLSKMGNKRAQEFSTLQKEVAEFINILKTNPKAALRNPNIGIDVKKLAAEILEEEIENSRKSPEQVEREKLENELKAIKEEREKEKEELRARELEQRTDLEFQRYDELISKAIEKNKDLPKSPYVVKKIAEYMMLGLENNIDVHPDDVMKLVKEEIQNDIRDMFGAMPDEVVEQFLGKDRMTSMRKKNIAKAKGNAPTTTKVPDSGNTAKPTVKKSDKKQTYKEFFKL
jgi:hypothetical protein